MTLKPLLLGLATLSTVITSYAQADSLSNCEQGGSYLTSPGEAIFKRTLKASIPMIAMALPYTLSNQHIKDIRNSYLPSFDNRYDDYLQFAPLVAQVGMRLGGIKGRSESYGEMLTADAISTAIMFSSVTLTKMLTQVERPDGSAKNSFPSGHTAMAFTAATLLHLEYGKKYPWISLLSYLTASGVGVGRVMNNRHWIGDVMVGASVGIASAELGYWLSSLLYKRPYIYSERECYFPRTDLRIHFPWSMGIKKKDYYGGGFGFGLRWQYDSKGYFLVSEGTFEGHHLKDSRGNKVFVRDRLIRLGWGKSWQIAKTRFSVDLAGYAALDGENKPFPSIRISPRLQLTHRLSFRTSFSYDHRLREQVAYSPIESISFSMPKWRIGSALEVRL